MTDKLYRRKTFKKSCNSITFPDLQRQFSLPFITKFCHKTLNCCLLCPSVALPVIIYSQTLYYTIRTTDFWLYNCQNTTQPLRSLLMSAINTVFTFLNVFIYFMWFFPDFPLGYFSNSPTYHHFPVVILLKSVTMKSNTANSYQTAEFCYDEIRRRTLTLTLSR